MTTRVFPPSPKHGPIPPPPLPISQASSQQSLHTQYRQLLSHERAAVALERQLWDHERSSYLTRINELEATVRNLSSGSTPAQQPPFSPQPTRNPPQPFSPPPALPIQPAPFNPLPRQPPPTHIALPPPQPGPPLPPIGRTPSDEPPHLDVAVDGDELERLLSEARLATGVSGPQEKMQREIEKEEEEREEEEKGEAVHLVLKKSTNFGSEFGFGNFGGWRG